MKSNKWQFPLFSFYDITGMEKYLERMAKKGWMLKKIDTFGYHYEKSEPKSVHYSVLYYPTASAFDPEPGEDQETFQDFCDHSGWHLAANNAKMLVFVNEKEDPVPIHTDPQTELEMLERSSKQFVICWLVLLGFILFNLHTYISFFRFNTIEFLASPAQLVLGVVSVLLLIYVLLDLSTWYIWKKRARAAADMGEALPATHGYNKFIGAVFLILIAGMAYILLTSRNPALFISVLSAFIVVLLVNGVRLALKKRKISKSENIIITLLVDVVICAAFAGLMLFVAGHVRRNTAPESYEETAVTAEMLSGIPQPESLKQLRRSSSFLLTNTEFSDTHAGNAPRNNDCSLSYQVLDVHFSPLYKPCLNKLLHFYDKHGQYDGDTAPAYVYEPADSAPWNANEVWQLNGYGKLEPNYLVCWDDTILVFKPDRLLDDAMISMVAEKLGPKG